METFSVKKPFTVLVGILMVIALGVVSVSRISTDLLPAFNLPYLMVIAPYPGASPERVETSITDPMENALGTINGVKSTLSYSYENYGLLQLEFEDGTNMDSAMVKVSSALDQLSGTLPESAGTPTLMEISMDMLATMYVAVNREGQDIYALSDFVRHDVVPYLERQDGVASVTTVGLVEKSVQVELNAEKIDALNEKILTETNSALADAKEKLDQAESAVTRLQKLLEEQQAQFGDTLSGTIFDQVEPVAIDAANQVIDQINVLITELNELTSLAANLDTSANAPETEDLQAAMQQLQQAASSLSADATGLDPASAASLATLSMDLAQIQTALSALSAADPSGALTDQIETALSALYAVGNGLQGLPSALSGLESGYAGLTQAQLEASIAFSNASMQLSAAESQLSSAREQYETSRKEALAQANADSLLSAAMLAQLIYAENFAMPAGYIDDADSNAWLLRIGDAYTDADEIADVLLLDHDALGTIRLSDVADITVIDNADDHYANLNGSDGVILCLYKTSTAGTNQVSRACQSAFAELSERYEGTTIVPMMDQGIYITYIIQDILTSMLLGAALAILVLALFLRTVKPTLVVAISIPLSVLFTLVLMYFTGLSLNMMTLSGLALGVGMLVDNSIVVMENIFRLRSRGIPAARAAVQGAKQVRGAITASTLTTICVFLPIAFASGTVRQLLSPLALSIGYCLAASLIVSLTVVPAASSTLLKRAEGKELRFFSRLQERYGRSLDWCLRHKLLTVAVAIALLVLSVWQVLRMGIVFLPEMTSNYIEVDVSTPAAETREESYAQADTVLDRILQIDGVLDVGMMDEGSTAGLVSAFSASDNSYGAYIGYLTAAENASPEEIKRICRNIQEATADLDCEVRASASGISDLTSYMSSGGLTLQVYGQDLETLEGITADLKDMIDETDGFLKAKDGTESGDPTLQLHIDRDKAMTYGLTVAQIYQEIAARVETKVQATSITMDGMEMQVSIADATDPLTRENLLDMTFAVQSTDLPFAEEESGDMTGMGMGLDLDTIEDMSDAELLETFLHREEEEEETPTTEAASQEEQPDTVPLRDFATVEETTSLPSIARENMTRYLTVTAGVKEGQNLTLLSRALEPKIEAYEKTLPHGYSIAFAGESSQISDMISQMMKMMLLALLFIYLVMVTQFQSLLSPFIVMFTLPLAFTGGMFALILTGQQLTLLSLMGFLVLMGTVVNNGIVFVDYTNQLRLGGLDRREALIATGKTRMRPILMTALTTILAMGKLIFGSGMGSQLGNGMAVVIAGGLIYATIMTLYLIPVIYDVFFRRQPLSVDVGEDLEEIPNDAAAYLQEQRETD